MQKGEVLTIRCINL